MSKQWVCTICGYVETGEAPPETCPICGADASAFEPVEEPEAATTPAPAAAPAPAAKPAGEPLSGEQAIKQALFKISYGLFVISANADGRDNGQCANTLFQITSEPPKIAIGINKGNFTHGLIQKSGKLGVSVLSQTGHDYARKFGYSSGRDKDKFADVAAHRGANGVLLLDDVLATMEATVVNQMDAGTHTLFLADVTKAELLQEGPPMTYDYFRATK